MSRGKWKRPQPDQVEVVLVSLPEADEAQVERWYAAWAILDGLLTALDEREAAGPIHVSEQTQISEGEPHEPIA